MILTGSEILKEVKKGNIMITPFDDDQINPNSYNYKLGPYIKTLMEYNNEKPIRNEKKIPPEGMMLEKGKMYLGHTYEKIGSSKHMISLIGRSSMGRLGLFLQLSANVGHTGTFHNRTLEIYPTINIIVYPGMKIGQVSFRSNKGKIEKYTGIYKTFNGPQESYLL